MKKIKTGQFEWVYKGYFFKFTKTYDYTYGLWYVKSGNFENSHNTMKQLASDIMRNLEFYKDKYQLWTEERMLKAKKIIPPIVKEVDDDIEKLIEVKKIVEEFENDKKLVKKSDLKIIFINVNLVKWMISEIEKKWS